ncbi:hypothetical protein ACROYT_G024719 [Oculina patagonica]
MLLPLAFLLSLTVVRNVIILRSLSLQGDDKAREISHTKEDCVQEFVFFLYVTYLSTCAKTANVLPFACQKVCRDEKEEFCYSYMKADYSIQCQGSRSEAGTEEDKEWKNTGIDGIPAELYKADSDMAIKELTRLFNRIWHEEKVPDQWRKGLIVKIPKRGDLKECKNWRGVTLLPVASKVMGRVIMERIQNGVDHVLRKE